MTSRGVPNVAMVVNIRTDVPSTSKHQWHHHTVGMFWGRHLKVAELLKQRDQGGIGAVRYETSQSRKDVARVLVEVHHVRAQSVGVQAEAKTRRFVVGRAR